MYVKSYAEPTTMMEGCINERRMTYEKYSRIFIRQKEQED